MLMVFIIIPLFVLMFLLGLLQFVECSLCTCQKLLSAWSQTSRRSLSPKMRQKHLWMTIPGISTAKWENGGTVGQWSSDRAAHGLRVGQLQEVGQQRLWLLDGLKESQNVFPGDHVLPYEVGAPWVWTNAFSRVRSLHYHLHGPLSAVYNLEHVTSLLLLPSNLPTKRTWPKEYQRGFQFW